MTSFTDELKETQNKIQAAGMKIKKNNTGEGTSKAAAKTRSQSRNREGDEEVEAVREKEKTKEAEEKLRVKGEGQDEDELEGGGGIEDAGQPAAGGANGGLEAEAPERGEEIRINEKKRERKGKKWQGGSQERVTGRMEGDSDRRGKDKRLMADLMFETIEDKEDMTPKERWWALIEFAFDTKQDSLAREMLRGFNLMYGDSQDEDCQNVCMKQGRSPKRFLNERPRTESLIVGDDNEEEEIVVVRSGEEERNKDRHRQQIVEERQVKGSEKGGRRGSITRERAEEELEEGEETEGGITYRIGKPINNSSLLPLTPYFEIRMRTLKAYIPLTVFDASRIERDQRATGKKKIKTLKELQEDDSSATYPGLVPNEELLMTYGFWVNAMDLFIRYLEKEYERPKAAKIFLRHKENVVMIKRTTKCWMVALRYDMKVRKGGDGRKTMEDAGYLHEDLLREAKEDADAAGERCYTDNPYVPGGGKENVDPVTGLLNSSGWGGQSGSQNRGETGGNRGRGRGNLSGNGRGGTQYIRGGSYQNMTRGRGSGWFQGRGAGCWAKQRGGSLGGNATGTVGTPTKV
ncbi:hypothetical protein DFH28DRAFT_896056 [Melampsora americana]|nr:hypothetical protein DFH28DRAFT_896056 [Melampsora americana]